MTVVYVFAGLGVLFALAVVLVLIALLDEAVRRATRRWRLCRRMLAEDLTALGSWARMTRAHLQAAWKLAREMERQARGGGQRD